MTFFVEKRLAVGKIRFSVAPHDAATADSEVVLSTGPNGEFVRRHSDGYFLGDAPRFDGTAPGSIESNSIARVPFWMALKPEGTAKSWGIVALLPLGLLLVLLGLAALVKSPIGLVYIIFGLILIAIPIIRTAQRRKKIREEEA